MAILIFTLSPEGISKLHDALVCLGKFSESVSIEASHDKVRDLIFCTFLTRSPKFEQLISYYSLS